MDEKILITDDEFLRHGFEEFRKTPESFTITLQMSLSRLILEALRDNGWRQRDLAEKAQVKESFLTRVIHGDSNWTAATAGKLLCALGERAVIQRKHDEPVTLRLVSDYVCTASHPLTQSVNLYGKEKKAKTEEVRFGAEGS